MYVTETTHCVYSTSNHTAVCAPNGVLDWRSGNFGQSLLLLDVVQNNLSRAREQQRGCTTVEDLVCLHRRLDGLGDCVREVADLDHLRRSM
jgi:hypothetical protein